MEPITTALGIAAAKGLLMGVAKALPKIQGNVEEAAETIGREVGQAIGLDSAVQEQLGQAFKDGVGAVMEGLSKLGDSGADGIDAAITPV